jgi:replicative DNA helicase
MVGAKKEATMKRNYNSEIGLIGLLTYKPELLPLIADTVRPEMFGSAMLAQCAGELWASHEAGRAWGAQDLRDFNEELAEQALARPIPAGRIDQVVDKIKGSWEAAQIDAIFREAARIAAKGDAIGARSYAESNIEILSATVAKPNEKMQTIMRSIAHMERYFTTSQGNRVTGIDTGFATLNRWTSGWQSGDLNVLAAFSGKGKTTVTLQSGIAAAKNGHPVLFFSCGDSTAEQMYMKAAAIIAGIDMHRIISNTISTAEKAALTKAYETLSELPFRVYDTSEFSGTVGSIRDICRRQAIEWGEKKGLVIIDYIQQVEPDRPTRDRVENIRIVSREIKQRIAVALHCPVIIVSQLNRDGAKGGIVRKPINADLRGSGDIEQDASRVIFVHHQEGVTVFHMTKDRHGTPDLPKDIELKWRADIGRYEWVFDSFTPSTTFPADTPAMVGARSGDGDIPF